MDMALAPLTIVSFFFEKLKKKALKTNLNFFLALMDCLKADLKNAFLIK
jgi:hypothetical protein